MIAVIGGSGFIGTRLVNRLWRNRKTQVSIVDKIESISFPGLTTVADVRNIDALRPALKATKAIINLAAEHRDDIFPLSLYDEVNVQGAANIAQVARETGINIIIFTSSVAIYGFAPIGTDESGVVAPFNDYGRTKYEAEQVFKAWQSEDPARRTLVIIRPTVVFGEQNRGNVFNLLRQIASGKFVMIGKGENRKSLAYVENVAAFIEHCLTFSPGIHTYNYIDKPDFTMNMLVRLVNRLLGRSERVHFRLPFVIGLAIGKGFDTVAKLTGKSFAISAVRVKKFCANSVYNSAVDKTCFIAPVSLEMALERTIRHEFIESQRNETVFFTD